MSHIGVPVQACSLLLVWCFFFECMFIRNYYFPLTSFFPSLPFFSGLLYIFLFHSLSPRRIISSMLSLLFYSFSNLFSIRGAVNSQCRPALTPLEMSIEPFPLGAAVLLLLPVGSQKPFPPILCIH